jgi:hypothetical protein
MSVPALCPIKRPAEGCHGYSWRTRQSSRPGLTHVNRDVEET